MAASGMSPSEYFVFGFPLADEAWNRYAIEELWPAPRPETVEATSAIRGLASRVVDEVAPAGKEAPTAEELLALRTINRILRHITDRYFQTDNPGSLERGRSFAAENLGARSVQDLHAEFATLYPAAEVRLKSLPVEKFLTSGSGDRPGMDLASREILLLFLNVTNPAARNTIELYDDTELRRRAAYIPFVTLLEEFLDHHEPRHAQGTALMPLLRAPVRACPDSLTDQIRYMREHWAHLLPDELLAELVRTLDVMAEADARREGGAGPPRILEFGADDRSDAEPEAFSRDADWMSNVVLLAKSTHVWLDQLSRTYERAITNLADIPDEELDRLRDWGVTGLWLIGLWERSPASARIKQNMGNAEAAASAYALYEYGIADELGGEDAWRNLSERAGQRGIRLASDMVPNHMGLDSRWLVEHPEYFLQLEHPPYPGYRYTGPDLCEHPGVAIRIEDGYWDHSDAAVVFQRVDEHSGDVRYIYHGNDGTSTPWNDTAQLNYLLPEVREAVIRVILDVARRFPIIRFDAAMTLARKHYQRLWFPAPGDAGAIPSRAEHGMSRPEFETVFPHEFWREVVDRVAAEAPDTLLLAEAFWLMEGYFVRTLGMHRVYNSAFMNMLKMEENAKYRQTIRNVLEFSPEILKRFVNFMNNPDEETAVEQFGRDDKYFGCALMLVTMPGLPMLGHGQIEGFSEKYGMEYRRAYWDESADPGLVARHEREIFPMMKRRHLFSGAEKFALFDYHRDGGWVDDNVFAYTNRHGDEKALILFNNSYESTTGRLHRSTPINRGSGDQPRLETVSLIDALGLETGPGLWYRIRDHIDGLEYLRSAEELQNYGFHSDLRGYQSRVLLGFEPVRDTDGLWPRIAESLAGGGAPNLDRVAARLQRDHVLAPLRTWFTPEILGALEPGADDADLELPGAQPPFAAEHIARWRALSLTDAASGPGTAVKKDLTDLAERLPGSRIPQALYLGAILADWPEESDDFRKGDDELLAEDMERALLRWTGHEHAARTGVLLARILAHSDGMRQELAAGSTEGFFGLIDHPDARNFLNIHRHEGRTWLDRDALLTLLDALAVGTILEADKTEITSALDACALIAAAASDAGYDLDIMRRNLG